MKHEASINVSSVKWLTRLAGGLLLATGLFLISPSGFAADNPQDDAAFTCSSAINVMDCIKQTGTGAPAPTQPLDVTALPINSGLLGFTGPVSVGIRYDNYLAWILDFGYVQSFLDNNAAAALKLSAGLNERRANVSLGYAITPKQQIKLTYEYLAQNLPFDFASGKVNEWVSQNALGASYRYIIGHNILKNIELYGTYTKASSKELTEKEMYINNLLTQINYRRIAGGTEMTAGGNVTLAPLKGTILKVGAGYSSLSFDTKWQDKEATAALVYNAELAHLLTPTTLVSTGIGNTASGRTHTAKVSQILPWSLEASLIGQYVATTNDIPGSTSVSASLSYPAPKTYENMITAGLSSIKDWVEKPVVYHSRVLAKAEERLVQVQITTKPIPPLTIAVDTTLNPPIQTKDYFAFNKEVFDKITYQITSITQKNNKDNVFKPEVLGLQVVPTDNYNAVLNSATATPVVAMTPGNYILTLEAAGYRKEQVVSRVPNSIDITVTGNPNIDAANWNNPVTLPPAVPGNDYDSGSLYGFVTGIKNEPFTFSITPITAANWIILKDDRLTGKPDPQDTQDAVLELTAKSRVSDKEALPNPLRVTIAMTKAFTLPNWQNTQNPLPATANQGVPFGTSGEIILNPYSPYNGTYLTKTKNGNTDINNDTLTFSKPNPTPGDACTWIDIDPLSGKLSGTPPDTALNTKCKVYANVNSAIAAADPKNPTQLISNLISVNSGYHPPTWSNQELPDAILGLDYGSFNNKNNLPFNQPVILDPYESSAAIYVTKTTDLNNNPVPGGDTLTFTVKTSGEYGGSNDPLDCANWLKLKPASQLFGVAALGSSAPPGSTYCNAYIEITSVKTNSTYFLPPKRINFKATTYIDPKWNNNNLPGATSTVNYNTHNVRLDSYKLQSPQIEYVDKAKIQQTGDYVTNDTWSNFILTNKTCDWLLIDNSTGDLSGTPSASASPTCNFVVQFYSEALKRTVTLDKVEILINSTKPLWQANTSTNDVPFSSTQSYAFDLKNFIQNPTQDPNYLDSLNFTLVGTDKDLPPPGFGRLTNKGIMPINMSIDSVVGKDSTYTQNQGTFTTQAINLGGVPSDEAKFTVRVVGNVNPPTQKLNPDNSTPTLPLSTPDVYYSASINPYNNNIYLNKTTVTEGNQTLDLNNDVLHFLQTGGPGQPPSCNTWATLSDQGDITGTPKQGIQCTLYFTIFSEKSGKPPVEGSLTIPTTTVAPSWDNSKLQNLKMKFDTIECTSDYLCIDLNYILLNTAAITPNLDFNFINGGERVKQLDNWRIKKDETSHKFYLLRTPLSDGSVDAGDVDTTRKLSIIAINEQGSANPADFNVTVLPDPNISFQIKNGPIQLQISSQITANPGAPLIDRLFSCVESTLPCPHPTINDVIDLSKSLGTVAVNVPTNANANVTVARTENAIELLAQPYLMTYQDAKTYDLKLDALTSKAAGPTRTTVSTFAGQFVVAPYANAPVWNSTLPSGSVLFDDQGKTNLIDLNDQIVKGTEGANLRFEIDRETTKDPDNWGFKTETSGTTTKTYLIRQGLNAIDIGAAKVSIKAINDTGTSDPVGTFSVVVLPDPNIKLVWKKDYSIPVNIGDNPSSIPIDINLIQSCIDLACNIRVVNDQITKINTTPPLAQLPSGKTIEATEDNGSYFLTIPTLKMLPNSDAGTKTLTFNGVTTKAQPDDTIVTGALTLAPEPSIIINPPPPGETAKLWDGDFGYWRLFRSISIENLDNKLIDGVVYELETQVSIINPKDSMSQWICPKSVTEENVSTYQSTICSLSNGTGIIINYFAPNFLTRKYEAYTFNTAQFFTFVTMDHEIGQDNEPTPGDFPVIIQLKFTRK